MWPGHLTIFIAALLFNLEMAEDDFIAMRTFLRTPASYVNLTSEAWHIHEKHVEFTVAIRFRPKTKVGQVFRLGAIGQHGRKIAKLTGSLHNGFLQINLLNGNDTSILNKPFSTHFLEQNREHNLAVRINTANKTLSYRFESTTEHNCEITEDIDLEGAEFVVTLGDGGNSMIGCVALVTVEIGGVTPPYEVIIIASNEIDDCADDDDDECTHRDCNKGRCVQLEVATCDCYGTETSGPNCRYPARSVFVLNNDDESQPSNIQYTPWKVDQLVHRITIDFKFAELDNKQGVLLHSQLNNGSVMKLYVVENNGNLLFESLGQMNFTLDSTKEFHSIVIVIHHDSRSVDLVVDGQPQKISFADSTVDLSLSSLLFGGSPATNGARELGITACLKNVYVDHHDIIYMMYDRDKRVQSSMKLDPCKRDHSLPDLFAIGSPLFSPDIIPNEDSQPEPALHHFVSNSDSVHKAELLSPASRNDAAEAVPCEKSQEYVCRNGAVCERHSNRTVCVCKQGFSGKYCQFTLRPRTCAEAYAFHGIAEGPVQLDVDGSRPLYGSVAVCRHGITTVPHDMPNGTVIRSSDNPTHALFIVSYRDFSNDKLSRLIKNSGFCKQQILYECNNAALGFESKRTWFNVAARNQSIAQIGRVPNSCSCMDIGCIKNLKCNCDSRAITVDSGYLYGEDTGITRVVALHSEGDVNGRLTVGPLECEGFSGDGRIRFSKPRALSIRDWRGESLSLQFRTAVSSATVFSVQDAADVFLKAELINGHMIRVSLGNSSVTVESQARLNDTKWHLLLLEIVSDEMRISVDSYNAYTTVIKDDIPSGKLLLNDDNSGFTGCVRSMIINDEVIDIQFTAKDVDGLYLYCDDRCNADFCQNSAECIEDFATDAVVCRCKYPNVQSGRNCEIDINQNSSVTINGGFLKYEMSRNPLVDQTVISFRTDRSQALIMFVHDHHNNFMQLHLSEEVNLTLSLNNENIVSSCTVRARPGIEFSNMEWIQITIEHSTLRSTLTVEDDACSIHTPRKLAEKPVQKFINVFTDIVIIPVGLNSPANPKPFVYTFVGGVEKESHSSDGSMFLRPIYQCAVPNLLGCVRGLKIGGEVIGLRHTAHGNRPSDPNSVRSGCDVGCHTLNCKNGGHCSVAWHDGEQVSCDCSRTSYAGSECTVDEGIVLSANSFFLFDMGRVLSRYILTPHKRTSQTMQFSFAPTSPSTGHQLLASVVFNDERLFEVILNKNGSINVAIVDENKRVAIRTFVGNFSDGFRHFFVARFGKHQATVVTEISLGGQRAENRKLFSTTRKNNYSGCVSNLDVDYGVPALHVTPISYLYDPSHSLANYSSVNPPAVDVVRGVCAPFRIPNSLPVFRESVDLPIWETNFKRLVYHDEHMQFNNDDEGKLWIWMTGIIIVLFIFCLVITAITCCCWLMRTESNKKPVISKDEEQPLRTLPPPEILDGSVKSMPKRVTISVPQNPTSRNHVEAEKSKQVSSDESLLSSLRSGMTAYFTAQESLSSDESGDDGDDDDDDTDSKGNDVDKEDDEDIEDLDATLCDTGEEDYNMQDVTRQASFDQISLRLSSFRQSDSSSPKQSPLFTPPPLSSSPRSLRPIPIPVPPPRMTS